MQYNTVHGDVGGGVDVTTTNIQYNTIQYNTITNIIIDWNATNCIAVQYNVVHGDEGGGDGGDDQG